MKFDKNICIIGCGIAGISALRVFSEDIDGYPCDYSLCAYERANFLGGVWNYNENPYAEFSSPIYRDLTTNLPKELMIFPDFPFPYDLQESFISHTDVLCYIQDYAKHYNLERFIEFNTEVINVDTEVIDNTSKWKVKTKNLQTLVIKEKYFDMILICNGHFEKPKIPKIRGIENFKGEIIHSKYYRVPEKYKNKTVFVLGAKSSGADIALQLMDFAKQVYISHNGEPITWNVKKDNFKETTRISHIESEGNIFLLDGSEYKADAIIFCTGYKIDLSFLSKQNGLNINDNYVQTLYKDLINPHYFTSCFFIGLGYEIIPPMHCYLQSKVARSIFHDCHQNIILSTEELMKDIEEVERKFENNHVEMRHRHFYTNREISYFRWCTTVAEKVLTYEIPNYLGNMFEIVKQWRSTNLSEYKKHKLLLTDESSLGFVIER